MGEDRDILQQLSKPDLWKIYEYHADKLGVRVEIGEPPSRDGGRVSE